MVSNKLISLLISNTKKGLEELYQLFESKEYDTITRILCQFMMIGDYNTLTQIIYDNTILDIVMKHHNMEHINMELYKMLFSCYYSCYHDGLHYNYKRVKEIKAHILKQIVNKSSFDKSIFTFIKRDFFFSIMIWDVINYIYNRKKRCEFINHIIEYMNMKHYKIYSNMYLFQMGIYNIKWYYCDDYNADKIIRTMV